jgi:hypothetical protein
MNPNHISYIEVLKRRLQQQQLVRKKIEMQLQRQKKIQQRIYQQIKQQQIKEKEESKKNVHTEVLSTEQQVNLLNDKSFVESLPSPPNPNHQRNTLTIQMGPKPIFRPKITPPVAPQVPEKEKEPLPLSFVESFLKDHEMVEENQIEENIIKEKYYSIPPHPQLPKNISHLPLVQIYGPFNTGTNLLVVLFEKIFRIQIPREGSAKKWKHTLEIQNFPNYFHILFVKNPFSWFQSMKKQPYNLIIPNHTNLLHQSVIMKPKNDPWTGDHFVRRFTSISKIWFYYYQMYMNFATKHPNAIIITYEEILYDNQNLFQHFSDILKIPLPANFEDIRNEAMKRPAKPHGQCNNLNKALKANQLETMLQKYQKKDVERFFQDVPMNLIIPHHQRLWDLQKWKDHFGIQ